MPFNAPKTPTFPGFVRLWEIITVTFVSGSFLLVADVLFNGERALTTQVRRAFDAGGFGMADTVGFETAVFVGFILIGLALCWLTAPRHRGQVLVNGASVLAVLVAINTALNAMASPAAAAGIHVKTDQHLHVTAQTPKPYGAFGLGTWFNGNSNAVTTPTQVNGTGELVCMDQLTVGTEKFCGISRQMAQNSLRNFRAPQDANVIWVRFPSE